MRMTSRCGPVTPSVDLHPLRGASAGAWSSAQMSRMKSRTSPSGGTARRRRGPAGARRVATATPPAPLGPRGSASAPMSSSICGLVADEVRRLRRALRAHADGQQPARLIEREDVLVGLVVADVDRGVAARGGSRARSRAIALVRCALGQDVDHLLAADHAAPSPSAAAASPRMRRPRPLLLAATAGSEWRSRTPCPRSRRPGSAARCRCRATGRQRRTSRREAARRACHGSSAVIADHLRAARRLADAGIGRPAARGPEITTQG